jgi:hypothetical protein
MSTQERFDEAANRFSQALQDAWTPPHIQERGGSAYSHYMQALQDAAQSELQQRTTQAYSSFMQVIWEALQRPDIQTRAIDAYRDYVRAVRDAWAEIEAETVDPAQLLAISQSMMATAWSAGLTFSASPGGSETHT